MQTILTIKQAATGIPVRSWATVLCASVVIGLLLAAAVPVPVH